ncbi:probable 18S rRNA (guanine-N(7))-methyltransferase isoform X2 [Pomacea canaliculata]|nr:probable 18S rRNA (guanine-N(7))-methyltransferase isoform X2 [Pomacea canaliculata]XP_025090937.1 probable 18S rRNA (guanine-N(7))-methyltransferase isoform X2 [Pomacea canaliculata]
MIEIQQKLSERAMELLALPEDTSCYILDIGCGSGLSGECLTDNDHVWVGMDISPHMLDIAREREVEGDIILGDMGDGMPFRPGSFDGVISISALQWLCNADKAFHKPAKRLYTFFSTLYGVLSRGARAVFQFYPENSSQIEMITQQAMKAGFTGGLVVDYPNSTKAKKMFLCLFAGGAHQQLPTGLGTDTVPQESSGASFSAFREKRKRGDRKPLKNSREWILQKKERRRKQGREVPVDTKYTGRKRKARF